MKPSILKGEHLTWHSFTFSNFMGHFTPSGIRIQPTKINADPRESGSTTRTLPLAYLFPVGVGSLRSCGEANTLVAVGELHVEKRHQSLHEKENSWKCSLLTVCKIVIEILGRGTVVLITKHV